MRTLVQKLRRLLIRSGNQPSFVPAGHFYSPIASIKELSENKEKIYQESLSLDGIDINLDQQRQWLKDMGSYHNEFPYLTSASTRYKIPNQTFAPADAYSLYAFMRTLKPKRIIEVGSGMSSAVMMDVNEKFFDNRIQLTFIEPFPDLLRQVLRSEDNALNQILVKKVQDVSFETFGSLEENDILFIDSSHVSKMGSDVNYLFFHVLPKLKKGVYVHVHDINVHFEYPWDWVAEGRTWNEAYLLRAFLMFNSTYSIQYFNSYMAHYYRKEINECLPFMNEADNSGGSIWLKKET